MHLNWKGRSKINSVAENIILYAENPKDSTKNPVRTNKEIQ